MTTEGLPVQQYQFENNSRAELFIGFLGFLLIGIVLFFSFFWAKDVLRLGSIPEPTSLAVTNISNNSFTVAWETNANADGYILYGVTPKKLVQKAYDNKAIGEKVTDFKTKVHAVTLTNLNPDTHYYYKIVSGSEQIDSIRGNLFKPVKTTLFSPFIEN